MWFIFVDDAGVHGENTEHCDLRSDCFEDVIAVMGKELSLKNWATGVRPPASPSDVVAGLNFSDQGVCPAWLTMHWTT